MHGFGNAGGELQRPCPLLVFIYVTVFVMFLGVNLWVTGVQSPENNSSRPLNVKVGLNKNVDQVIRKHPGEARKWRTLNVVFTNSFCSEVTDCL